MTSIARVDVQDARTDTQLGMRSLQGKGRQAAFTSSNDPASWVRDGVLANLHRDGFVTGGSSEGALST
jgi:hypothetical protein